MNETSGKKMRWLLAGAGNAHLKLLRMLAMNRPVGSEFWLVNRASRIPYSAMLPRAISGELSWEDVEIDLARFCADNGFEFRLGEIRDLSVSDRELTVSSQGRIRYDYLSLSLGAEIRRPSGLPVAPNVLTVKPLDVFARSMREAVSQNYRRWVIVGGGASGCEIALALAKRFHGQPNKILLIQADAEVVPTFPPAARKRITAALAKSGVELRCGTKVTAADATKLIFENGESVTYDACILATEGAPPELSSRLRLPKTASGFLDVNECLQLAPQMFAAGDCVSIRGLEHLPRNGVYAVREGQTLFSHISRIASGKSLEPFRPQKRFLGLFDLADGRALLTYGNAVQQGRWCLAWKHRIDREWLQGFRNPTMTREMPAMLCGGCGSKVPAPVLRAALDALKIAPHPDILAGCQDGEDVAVHRPPADRVEVQTVDFFQSFVGDPRLFGELTAIHALNDIHAANAHPFSALAMCTIPPGSEESQQRILREMLEGANSVLTQHATTLTGGHTTQGDSMGLGFALTAYAQAEKLFSKRAGRVGEDLIITKPIGTGALLAALMRNSGAAEWFEALLTEMRLSNARAAQIFSRHGVTTCTDISGFGLWGHLHEMLGAQPLQARLQTKAIPVYHGFDQVTRMGIFSTVHAANRVSCGPDGTSIPEWAFDPQTCGGLLATVRADWTEKVVKELRESGYRYATRIGALEAGAETRIVFDK